MIKAVGLRLIWVLGLIWLTVTVVFFLVRIIPGNPVTFEMMKLLGQGYTYQAAYVKVQELYGVNLRLSESTQYWTYIRDFFMGNWGVSIVYDVPCIRLVAEALPWTIFSGGTALLLSFLLGIPAGTYMAYRRGGLMDRIAIPVSSVLTSIPSYIVGLFVVFVFGVLLGWFPVEGPYGITVTPGLNGPFLLSVLYHGVLPILTYAFVQIPGWMLAMRGSAVTIIGQEFIVGARSLGVSEFRTVMGYVVPNAILPLFTQVVLGFGYLFAGAVFVESIFAYPGVGYLFGQATGNRDFPLMEALFAVMTIVIILANLLSDILYTMIDPRITVKDAL